MKGDQQVSSQETDDLWAALANEDASTREPKMLGRYKELASLGVEDREERLPAMARAEYALPREALTEFSASRIKLFLEMDSDDARKVADSYEAVMKQLPAEAAWARVTIGQSLAGKLSPEDEERLLALLPGIFAGGVGHRGLSRTSSEVFAIPPVVETAKRKPFWAFWRA